MTMKQLENMYVALVTLDVDSAREILQSHNTDDETLLVALHKARYDCPDIPPIFRYESGAWLYQKGFRRFNGLPLLPFPELPE